MVAVLSGSRTSRHLVITPTCPTPFGCHTSVSTTSLTTDLHLTAAHLTKFKYTIYLFLSYFLSYRVFLNVLSPCYAIYLCFFLSIFIYCIVCYFVLCLCVCLLVHALALTVSQCLSLSFTTYHHVCYTLSIYHFH